MSYKWTTYMMAQLETLPADQRGTRHEQIKEALEEGYLCGVVEMLFDELKEARSVGDDLAVLVEEKESQLEEAKAEIKFVKEQFTAFQKKQEAFTQAGLKATAESSALLVKQAAQLAEALEQKESADAWLACAQAEIKELKVQLVKVTAGRDKYNELSTDSYIKIDELSANLAKVTKQRDQAFKDVATLCRLHEELVDKIRVKFAPAPVSSADKAVLTALLAAAPAAAAAPASPLACRWYRAPEVDNDGKVFHWHSQSSEAVLPALCALAVAEAEKPALSIRCPVELPVELPPRIQRCGSFLCDSPSSIYD